MFCVSHRRVWHVSFMLKYSKDLSVLLWSVGYAKWHNVRVHWVTFQLTFPRSSPQIPSMFSITLGSPVVPLVYMMVHRSSGLGGTGGAGAPRPSARNCSHEYALMPACSATCIPHYPISVSPSRSWERNGLYMCLCSAGGSSHQAQCNAPAEAVTWWLDTRSDTFNA